MTTSQPADSEASGGVRLEIDGPVATLVLDRPRKVNALTRVMLEDFERHLGLLEEEIDVRAVVLAGEGPRGFCVGADVAEWGDLVAADPVAMWRTWDRIGHRVLDRLAGLPMPVIAALHGHVLGGGLELGLAADLRIAAEDAWLGLPEVRVGTQPGWGGSSRLAALVGLGRAKQLVLTGEAIDASTALAWGLVNAVVPAAELRSTANGLAARIAANPPVAVALAKATFNAAAGGGTALALEGIAGALGAGTSDGREGVAAFRAKRPPEWTGR